MEDRFGRPTADSEDSKDTAEAPTTNTPRMQEPAADEPRTNASTAKRIDTEIQHSESNIKAFVAGALGVGDWAGVETEELAVEDANLDPDDPNELEEDSEAESEVLSIIIAPKASVSQLFKADDSTEAKPEGPILPAKKTYWQAHDWKTESPTVRVDSPPPPAHLRAPLPHPLPPGLNISPAHLLTSTTPSYFHPSPHQPTLSIAQALLNSFLEEEEMNQEKYEDEEVEEPIPPAYPSPPSPFLSSFPARPHSSPPVL